MNSRGYLIATTMPALYHDSPDERRKRAIRRTPRGKKSYDSRPTVTKKQAAEPCCGFKIGMYVPSWYCMYIHTRFRAIRPLTKTTTCESLIRECTVKLRYVGKKNAHLEWFSNMDQ